jgi:hypothetical protein
MADSANHHGQQSCHVSRANPHILLEAMSEGLRREGHMSECHVPTLSTDKTLSRIPKTRQSPIRLLVGLKHYRYEPCFKGSARVVLAEWKAWTSFR